MKSRVKVKLTKQKLRKVTSLRYIAILIFDFIKEGCPSTELICKGPST